MANIGPALVAVKSEMSQLVCEADVQEACREAGFSWRRRKLDPLTTIHLLLLQLLAKVALGRLDRVAQLGVSAAAICKARMRLPLEVWRRLAERVGRPPGAEPSQQYEGHRVVLCDGTTSITEDKADLAKAYGKASNHRSTQPGYPMPKLLALMDLASGMITKIIDLPHARSEQTVLTRMLKALMPGDLLLGDRGLVGFAQVALMVQAQIHCLLRLPKFHVVKGRGKGQRRLLRRLGRQDLLVRWSRPRRHTLSWMSFRRWRDLPQTLDLRQIAFRLNRPGFRTQWAWVITTLQCPKRYAAQSLVELYGRRWQIETAFRDLKESLGMQKLSARTLNGAKKELLAFVMLYNLVRRVMARAARRQGVTPDRIGFRDALTALLWLRPGEPVPDLQVNQKRDRATEPRARKHCGYQFPVLRRPRKDLRTPRARAVIGATTE